MHHFMQVEVLVHHPFQLTDIPVPIFLDCIRPELSYRHRTVIIEEFLEAEYTSENTIWYDCTAKNPSVLSDVSVLPV